MMVLPDILVSDAISRDVSGSPASATHSADTDGTMHHDLQYRFGRLLTVTTRAWSIYMDQCVAHLGLTGPRWHLLVELANVEESPSQRELAELLNIEAASLIKMLDALEAAGLVSRVPHQTDRRTKIVQITEAGREVMHNISIVARDVREMILQGVSEEEIMTCMKVFSVIKNNLEYIKA